MVIVVLILFLFIGCGLFSKFLVTDLELPYVKNFYFTWGNKNAVVLLGAGTIKLPKTTKPSIMSYSRIYEAARTYYFCKKLRKQCTLIVSGGDALHTGLSEAVVYQNALIAIGVNQSDIILEPNSMNTYQNAEFTSRIIKARHFDHVFLITSGMHVKRALLFFSQFGISAIAIPSDYIKPIISFMPLGYNFAITDLALHEYLGIAELYLYNYFGWNSTQ